MDYFEVDSSSSCGYAPNIDGSEVENNVSALIIVENVDLANFSRSYDVRVNKMFFSKEYLVKIICMNAIKINFEFRVKKSEKTPLYLECIYYPSYTQKLKS